VEVTSSQPVRGGHDFPGSSTLKQHTIVSSSPHVISSHLHANLRSNMLSAHKFSTVETVGSFPIHKSTPLDHYLSQFSAYKILHVLLDSPCVLHAPSISFLLLPFKSTRGRS